LAEIYTILGRTYKNLGRFDEAIAAHQKSLEVNPDYEKAWNNLGNTYMALKQYAEVEHCMERAVECEPTYVFALASLGAVYINRGKADKAVAVLEQATALNPKMTVAHANLALAHAKAGRFAEARLSLTQAKTLGYANWQTVQKQIGADEAKAPKPVPKPKDESVYSLETARIELERVRIIIGNVGDYLDRGRPSPEERDRTKTAIQKHEEEERALETKFNALVDNYRQKNPAVIKVWIQLHLEILEEIIAQ
jgi:tetratricopeptide (TPR) repeat protein